MASAIKMSISSILLLANLLLTTSTSVLLEDLCWPSDENALLALKDSLNFGEPSWIPGTHCCNWVGVKCNWGGGLHYGRVSSVIIEPSGEPGTIPAAIGDLDGLETLVIRHRKGLTGPIPRTMIRLIELIWLQLDHNALTGAIPSVLFGLPWLNYIDFSYNQLSGSIPSMFWKDIPLEYYYLNNNNLTGTIPESLGVPDIKALNLSNNNLTGPLPASFADAKFELLDLSNNLLTGDASLLFGAKRPLTTLLLSRSKLDFDLTDIVFPENLQSLDLSHNKIYGSIPKQIAQLKFNGLTSFNLSYNHLCGKIPTGGQMGQFDQSVYIKNKCLCGPPLCNA